MSRFVRGKILRLDKVQDAKHGIAVQREQPSCCSIAWFLGWEVERFVTGNILRTVILVLRTRIQPIINYAIYYQLDPQTTSEDDASLMYLLPTIAIANCGIYPARNDKLHVGLVNPTYKILKNTKSIESWV